MTPSDDERWKWLWPLLALPVVYATGFFVWALHGVTIGIGWIDVSTPRYAAAGIFVLLLIALPAALHLLLVRRYVLKNEFTRRVEWALVVLHMVFQVWCIQLVLSILLAVGAYPEEDIKWMWLWGLIIGLSPVLVFIVQTIHWLFSTTMEFGLNAVRSGLSRLWNRFKQEIVAPEDPSSERKRPAGGGPFPTIPRKNQQRAWIDEAGKAILLTSMMFATSLMATGFSLWGDISPEYGGGKERHAFLFVDQDGLDPALAAVLFNQNSDNGTAMDRQTVQLTVYYIDDVSIRARVTGNDAPKDPFYEISRNIIQAIHWID